MIHEHRAGADAQPVMRAIRRVPGIAGHLPARPSWTCAAASCPHPWPCPHARERITAAAGDRVELSITMAQVLNVAVEDLVHERGDHDLFRRMLAWTR
ncbi:hypothetical protein [Micromonospora sp. DT233]|uniref:hypothetical protein n=1 Tax=Micromonospora sp. DT233 TaxID=3393432 RepID=UPI003CED0EE4